MGPRALGPGPLVLGPGPCTCAAIPIPPQALCGHANPGPGACAAIPILPQGPKGPKWRLLPYQSRPKGPWGPWGGPGRPCHRAPRAPRGPQRPPGPFRGEYFMIFVIFVGDWRTYRIFGPKSQPWILPTVGRNPLGTPLILFPGPGYIEVANREPTIFHLTPGG